MTNDVTQQVNLPAGLAGSQVEHVNDVASDAAKRQTLVELATGKTRPATVDAPDFSSADGPWDDILLECHSTGGAYEVHGLAHANHVVVLHRNRPVSLEWGENEYSRRVTIQPGEGVFLPALMPFELRSDDIGEFIALEIDPRVIRRIAHEVVGEPGHLDWRPALPFVDPLLASLVSALFDEAKAGYPCGAGYAAAMTDAIAAHLLRSFAHNRPLSRPVTAGLGRGQLRRAIDYMQAHLEERVPLTVLAEQAGLSRFHFARRFKKTTGLSPHQYLIQCRLERARALLRERDIPVADVAVRSGFYDQSHLVSVFKRAFGVTPSQFRRGQP